ncbi:MAG: hypothetical protein KDK48_06850, partial [Chlamydiia bacterium]|nr:hypothetical protein [Chlamydiia bacterium]
MSRRLVVSLATIPTRIFAMRPTLDSLVRQTVRPSRIYLWYPEVFLRSFPKERLIPNFLSEYPTLKLGSCDDHLALNKLLPVLKEENDPETLIVTVDDDTVYPETLLENFLKWQTVYPHAALGLKGKTLLDWEGLNYKEIFPAKGLSALPQQVDVLIGGRGIFFKRGFLDEEVFEIQKVPSPYVSQDIWFAGMLAKRHSPRFVVPFGEYEKMYSYQNEVDALKNMPEVLQFKHA